MISFESDYNNGAHPRVLEHLLATNDERTPGYGFDRFSERAKERIREACETPKAEIYFLPGGTQTNATAIDGMLLSHEAVICAETGHIAVHEATAVEASGHKVITLPSHDGRLWAADLERFMTVFEADESRDHCAQPGMVYITFPTEYGTLYSAEELMEIEQVCHRHELKLYIDGARLGYGLSGSGDLRREERGERREDCEARYEVRGTRYENQRSAPTGKANSFVEGEDSNLVPRTSHLAPRENAPRENAPRKMSLPFIARHCDAFYIGGTKVGALCGEALVFPRGDAPKGFFSIVKRHGALMAKGRLSGVQFDALFSEERTGGAVAAEQGHTEPRVAAEQRLTEPLYFAISRRAVELALEMKKIFREKGYRLFIDSPTNQQFVVLPNDEMHRLEKEVIFTHWEPYDEGHTVCRFVTSWATTEDDVARLRCWVLGEG